MYCLPHGVKLRAASSLRSGCLYNTRQPACQALSVTSFQKLLRDELRSIYIYNIYMYTHARTQTQARCRALCTAQQEIAGSLRTYTEVPAGLVDLHFKFRGGRSTDDAIQKVLSTAERVNSGKRWYYDTKEY
uniref:Uncharacterized protein n=1 Tax=Trichogramma kaykai TaxID=54128 RepID=A0ABD2WZJ0_9HYME